MLTMNSITVKFKYLLIFCLLAFITCSGCAESKRASIMKRTRIDACEMSQMGKNRYFHSKHYKRNISRNTRRVKRR